MGAVRTYTFDRIDAAEPPLDGERICVRIPCTEMEEYFYYDLLFACLVVDYSKEFVVWDRDYAIERDPEAPGPRPVHVIVLEGTSRNGRQFQETLLEIQGRKNASSPDDTIPDEMQNLAAEMEDYWLDADTPLPKLYRDLRIEQLQFWILQDDPSEEDCRRIARDLVTLNPKFAEWDVLQEYL